MKNKATVAVRIKAYIHDEVKKIAQKKDTTIRSVIERAIVSYIQAVDLK